MWQKKSIFCITLILMLAVTCPVSAKASEVKELKIGSYLPLSGAGAEWGMQTQRGLEMARDDINAAGGLKIGKDKYLIKIIVYDHKYTTDGALEAVNRLVYQDKVKFIGGTVGTSPLLAGLSVTEPNKVISCGFATSDQILGPDKPYSFRTIVGGDLYTVRLYRWLRKKYPEAKAVAFLSRDDAFGRDLIKYGRNATRSVGMKIVYEDVFKIGTKDFSPWLAKVISSNPDILDNTGTAPGESGAIIKLARQLGYKGLIISSVNLTPETVLKIATPELTEGVISVMGLVWEPDDPNITPVQRNFAKRYVEKFKEPVTIMTVEGYDTTMIITKAIEKANTLDTVVVKDVMATSKYDLLQGEAWFIGEKTYGIRRAIIKPIAIIQCIGGRFRLMGTEMPIYSKSDLFDGRKK